MSDINAKSTVTLECNGEQAVNTLKQLKQRATDLENAVAKAAGAGNKANLKKWQSELNKTRKEIRACESATQQVEVVMKRLDKASPKELRSTLSTLKNQLNNIERNSPAWDAHITKIKKVKSELDSVNRSMEKQEGFFSRANGKINQWGMSIASAAAAFAGVIFSARQAVQAYADIEGEMANVRKYTGMTSAQVDDLNESFKKMDTRTSRQDLNKLAEEAGRLGKTSKEDVLGFVRAADKINVALDDLGEGATLTLSKLTGIFGDEKRLGTEKSLLAVGSVINELSQNCAASAPYLAEFASRMGGVGAQAGMTIQQIMGFGAVLDSNNQNVEASATAIAQVITRMYQAPAKYAVPAGLDVTKFTKLLKEDANAALITLLESLNKMGNMDALSPLFKDMGENGARAISALSTLASKIDDVKQQQSAANIAFSDAVSVDKEFSVQNNTVQADLDKKKKAFLEITQSLGQKLLPLMKYAISGSSAMTKALSVTISFIIEHRKAIIALSAVIVAYSIAANIAAIKTKALAAWQAICKGATVAWTIATQAAAVVTSILSGNLHKAQQEFKILAAVMKVSAMGLFVAGIAAVVAGLVLWLSKTNDVVAAEKNLNEIKSKAAGRMGEEKSKIDLLVAAAKNEKLSLDERHKAISQLNKIIPNYNGQLDDTTGKYRENKQALDDYILSLTKKYELEGAKDKLAEIGKQKAEAIATIDRAVKKFGPNFEKLYAEAQKNSDKQSAGPFKWGAKALSYLFEKGGDDRSKVLNDYETAKKMLDESIAQEKAILGVYGIDLQKEEVKKQENKHQSSTSTSTTSHSTTSSSSEKEDSWKESKQALNRIAYATGSKNQEQFQEDSLIIDNEYLKKRLENTKLSADDRLKIEADQKEAEQKLEEFYNKEIINSEVESYAERAANLKQLYIDGQISSDTYNLKAEEAEADHLRAMISATKEGSEERAKAEADYQDKLFENQKKRQQETEKRENDHQKQLEQIKSDFFSDTPSANASAYSTAIASLDEVYRAELQAAGDNAEQKLAIEESYQKAKSVLAEKYGQKNMNSLQKANSKFTEWLAGDNGQAVVGAFDTVTSGMSAIFSQVSSMVQADLELQTAAIEKRYQKEIDSAEGNNYKVAQLEKKKEAEIAKAKNEANKKMFAMQVIQAVAQTAQNAISAYGSAAAIPVVGFVLAPIAAAMAVAAGALQIAAIKKQAQASESQGYSLGGFTKNGAVNEPAGVVHAGEWVASQKLVNDPRSRAIINALDYAQRTNTIGSLSEKDVSTSVTAPVVLARSSADNSLMTANIAVIASMQSSIKALNDRLNLPFVTVNTVTGDNGTLKAQEDYAKLMKNKTPKSRQ